MSGITAYEISVLKAFSTNSVDQLTQGAALNTAAEFLVENGYMGRGGDLTDKGHGALGTKSPMRTERPELPVDDALLRAACQIVSSNWTLSGDQIFRLHRQVVEILRSISPAPQEHVRVKPLEWEAAENVGMEWAESIVGQFRVHRGFEMDGKAFGPAYRFPNAEEWTTCDTLEAAKTAAQFHYEAYVLSALAVEPPKDRAVVPSLDEIMEQAQVFASTYSLAGGRFDDGTKFQQSQEEKAELRRLIALATTKDHT